MLGRWPSRAAVPRGRFCWTSSYARMSWQADPWTLLLSSRSSSLHTMQKPSQKALSADIHLLGDLLGKVIRRQAGVDVYDLEERFRALSKVRRGDKDSAAEVTAKLTELVDRLSA